jgi:2-keto-4-pentenoate hydratase
MSAAGSADALAALLLAVRDGAPPLDPPPPELAPADLAAAYAVADRVVAALAPRLGPVRGWKVGATNARGQQMLGLDAPFYGRDFASTILRDDDAPAWRTDGRRFTVEAEVGFVLARDLPPRATPYDAHEVRAALARAVPLLEINRPAYARPFEIGGRWLVADNGVTQGLVVGGPGVALADLSLDGLAADAVSPLADETVRMSRNGEPCAEGAASAVLGDPLRAVHWLANALSARGLGLRAGDVVASGGMTPPVPMQPGDAFLAEYPRLGRVRLRVGD